MAITLSPQMNLPIPAVGTEPGPDYATDVNNSLTVIDGHDHSPGYGVPITPDGMNIDAALPFNGNFATEVAGVVLVPQSITPATLGTIHEAGDDLYYIDGVGNNIRLTQAGGLAGTPGSIAGLVPPASVTYIPVSETFVFESDANIAANIDVGSVALRNLSPNSDFSYTVSPPAALTADVAVTLPTLPAASANKIVRLNDSGTMTANLDVDNVTVQIISNQLVGIGSALAPNREHAFQLNGRYSGLVFPQGTIDGSFLIPANIIIQSIWIFSGNGTSGTTIFDVVRYASSGAFIGSVLSTTGKITATGGWTDSGSVIGAKAGFVKPVISVTSVSAGQALAFNLSSAMANATDCSVKIFYTLA